MNIKKKKMKVTAVSGFIPRVIIGVLTPVVQGCICNSNASLTSNCTALIPKEHCLTLATVGPADVICCSFLIVFLFCFPHGDFCFTPSVVVM